MNFLVDSNTILDFFNGKTELFHFFDDTENIYVSVISVGELNHMVRCMETKKNVVEIANDFCHLLHIVNIDEGIALEYGKLKSMYPDMADNKLWLCATAVVKDFVVVTMDEDIANLKEVVAKRF